LAFPALDVHQRLTSAADHGVLELTLDAASTLTGRTLGELEQQEPSLRVLTLTRDGHVLPNPAGELGFQVGDRLLCFGPHSALQHLLPAPLSQRRAPARGARPVRSQPPLAKLRGSNR
jgi:uncharacterized protein with PhoU and TrkA domain